MPGPLSKEELSIIEATKREGEKPTPNRTCRSGMRSAGTLLKSAVFYLIVLMSMLLLFSLIYTWGERIA